MWWVMGQSRPCTLGVEQSSEEFFQPDSLEVAEWSALMHIIDISGWAWTTRNIRFSSSKTTDENINFKW